MSLFDQMTNINWTKLWEKIEALKVQQITCDDREGVLSVIVGGDGDFHLSIYATPQTTMKYNPKFRARTSQGGGKHLKVRKALALLALAIKEDNEEWKEKGGEK